MEQPIKKDHCELLVLGGSAGSLDTLLHIISNLRVAAAAVVIVVHRKDSSDNTLVELLASRTTMLVKEAEDKEKILPATIYIAPPDYHLLIEKNASFSLDTSEKIHFSRPSIDATMETAAEAYTDKLIALLLSGANADGAAGLKKVGELGGITIIQDPASADVPFMPQYALSTMKPFKVVAAVELPDFLNEMI